ncbi:nuclear transport factor 2 family protein [Pyxidicoccus parkwayensis]|jgi:ketosteroid isomerase-like protein|uniref:Nuclear transport factor 2 family protein n=1 Tax=Pyxidicoccus parkwayensis TaxID=2813578 RepID=A0ABX7NK00_9BACT|nr:nuclear transport factor 2 family protein [Pyxidicoccus parkwaysis]QSQ18714.1 nuclear transport factor 2 family protein [Pyxidicoccus parkwaysis]
MSASENFSIAKAWLHAFNAHDVDALVALYAEDCRHTSPKIRVLHPETGGQLIGRPALAKWWREAIARLPGLRYEETALTADGDRVFMEYVRHAPGDAPMPVAEVLEVRGGKIVASRVYHG